MAAAFVRIARHYVGALALPASTLFACADFAAEQTDASCQALERATKKFHEGAFEEATAILRASLVSTASGNCRARNQLELDRLEAQRPSPGVDAAHVIGADSAVAAVDGADFTFTLQTPDSSAPDAPEYGVVVKATGGSCAGRANINRATLFVGDDPDAYGVTAAPRISAYQTSDAHPGVDTLFELHPTQDYGAQLSRARMAAASCDRQGVSGYANDWARAICAHTKEELKGWECLSISHSAYEQSFVQWLKQHAQQVRAAREQWSN